VTANPAALLPGAVVLIDATPNRGATWTRGDRGTVIETIGISVMVRLHSGVVRSFDATELLLVPADALYSCCGHGSCPDGCTGHPVPCTSCGQAWQLTADQQVAREMRAS
jgi:hypothetical protein